MEAPNEIEVKQHLISFSLFYEDFLDFSSKKGSQADLEELITNKIFQGNDKEMYENFNIGMDFCDKIREGIKTYEEGFKKIEETISTLKINDDQINNFINLCIEMYLFTNSENGQFTGDEIYPESGEFYKGFENYSKFNFFETLNNGFKENKVVEILLKAIKSSKEENLETREGYTLQELNDMDNSYLNSLAWQYGVHNFEETIDKKNLPLRVFSNLNHDNIPMYRGVNYNALEDLSNESLIQFKEYLGLNIDEDEGMDKHIEQIWEGLWVTRGEDMIPYDYDEDEFIFPNLVDSTMIDVKKIQIMQTIILKKNFTVLFSEKFLNKTTIENEFIYIDIEGSSLNISCNLDENDIDDSVFDDDEIPFWEIISELEEKLPQLKDFFTEDFEIIYFKYDSEYTSTMWVFDNNNLRTNAGWIGDFCTECEDIEDEDERDNARSEFVNENAAELKDSCPTEELLKEMKEGLYQV